MSTAFENWCTLIEDDLSEFRWIEHADILAPYGSRVYGTATEKSDYDFIAIDGSSREKKEFTFQNVNITLYGKKAFYEELYKCEISALETWFLPKEVCPEVTEILHRWMQPVILDFKLRASISHKASNSWVKAKKKLTVEKDYDPYIAKKSLFHSFRILNFGCQIAEAGKIYNYAGANAYWEAIKDLPADWELWNNTFKKDWNNLHSAFKQLAPKGK